jgi:tetratricopeptide (TPR) repeat protein
VKKDQNALSNVERTAHDKAIAEIKARNLSAAAESNEIGIIFAKEGKFADAEAKFRAALASDSSFAKAHNNLGNLFYLQGNNDKAKESYRDALRIGGENAAILANMATMYFEEGNAADAKKYFERALRLEPVYEREYPEIAALLRGDSKVAASRATGGGKASAVGGRDPRKSRWTP